MDALRTCAPGPLGSPPPSWRPMAALGVGAGRELCQIAEALQADSGCQGSEGEGLPARMARREAPAWRGWGEACSTDSSPTCHAASPHLGARAWSPDAAWVGEGSRRWGRPASLRPAPWASGQVMGRGCRPQGWRGWEEDCRARQWPGSRPRAPGQGSASLSTLSHVPPQLCTLTGGGPNRTCLDAGIHPTSSILDILS